MSSLADGLGWSLSQREHMRGGMLVGGEKRETVAPCAGNRPTLRSTMSLFAVRAHGAVLPLCGMPYSVGGLTGVPAGAVNAAKIEQQAVLVLWQVVANPPRPRGSRNPECTAAQSAFESQITECSRQQGN